jgi:integrase
MGECAGQQIEIQYGKTDNARRRIPLSKRVVAVLEMRGTNASSEWIFPAGTRSGHIEPCSLKRQHLHACEGRANAVENAKCNGQPRKWNVEPFPLYTLRRTCLTRWAPHMDHWALAYLAGHRDMSITKRYVHPREHTIRDAMERARGGHNSGHILRLVRPKPAQRQPETTEIQEIGGAPGVTRTPDLLVRSPARTRNE